MRTLALAVCAALLLPLAPAVHAATPRTAPGALVLVFKDGHRQTINLADVARIEFTGAADAAPPSGHASLGDQPARGQFVGRWVVGVGNGMGNDTFVINLDADGNAHRSLHSVHGTWTYVNGEARITWDDGAKDAIRKAGSKFQKYAYGAGKSFNDDPDNVTAAQNTTPHPI